MLSRTTAHKWKSSNWGIVRGSSHTSQARTLHSYCNPEHTPNVANCSWLSPGEDAAHEAIRQQLLEAGALRRAVAAMREHTDWGEVAAVGGGRGGRRRGAGREEVAEEQPLLPAAMRLLGTLLLDKVGHMGGGGERSNEIK